jgi:hypothetical protein
MGQTRFIMFDDCCAALWCLIDDDDEDENEGKFKVRKCKIEKLDRRRSQDVLFIFRSKRIVWISSLE